MWHRPPFNPVCFSPLTPQRRRRSSIISPRSFFNPPRYILPPLSIFPTPWSLHSLGELSCLFHRCTRYPVLSFSSRLSCSPLLDTLLASGSEHAPVRSRFSVPRFLATIRCGMSSRVCVLGYNCPINASLSTSFSWPHPIPTPCLFVSAPRL